MGHKYDGTRSKLRLSDELKHVRHRFSSAYLEIAQFAGPIAALLAVDAENDRTEDGLLRRRLWIHLQWAQWNPLNHS